MTMTQALARAAAQDTANDQAKKGGRKSWNRADYNPACRTFNRLCPVVIAWSESLKRFVTIPE